MAKVLKILTFCLTYIVLISLSLGESSILSRFRRQAGYFYDKPSVAFDLPTRQPSSTSTTQSPSSVATQAQQMYYAYPNPGGGDGFAGNTGGAGVVNIGFSTTGAIAANTANSGSGGYDYGAQGSSTTGGTSGSTYKSSTVTNTVQTSSSGPTGYNYDSPTPSTASGGGPAVSTNAPTYLPPTGSPGGYQGETIGGSTTGGYSGSTGGTAGYSGGVTGSTGGVIGSIGGVTGSTSGVTGSTGGLSVGVSNSYIPPASSPGSTVTAGSMLNIGTQGSTPPASPPSTAGDGYLPPLSPGSPTQGTISTPAPTYLPPLL